jgi:hypothetical protein
VPTNMDIENVAASHQQIAATLSTLTDALTSIAAELAELKSCLCRIATAYCGSPVTGIDIQPGPVTTHAAPAPPADKSV